MADTIAVTCPECDKTMQVPDRLAGKKVRCKGCEAAVTVPAPKAKDTFKFADDDQPKKAKKAKKVAPAATPASPPKKKDDFDEDANPYGTIADDSHIPRCAFCAKELDPPNARVCKNCGYDMMERRRHESKAVYENSVGDYLSYHATTIGAFLGICILIGLNVYCYMNMEDWFKGSTFEQDEKDPITNKPKYIVPPGFANTWMIVISLFIVAYAIRFIIRMLNRFHPTETLTAT